MNSNPNEVATQLPQVSRHLARIVLTTFLFSFIGARIIVFLIMTHRIIDLYIFVGGTHIHHLNFGIFLLTGVGAYTLFYHPTGRNAEIAATIYGIGLALTFDEFGMWLHLGGSYWQRASWDAIIVITAIFTIMAFAPSLKRFRLRTWAMAFLITLVVGIFFFLLLKTIQYKQKNRDYDDEKIEKYSYTFSIGRRRSP
ncbi:MAG: hypothetical protein ACMUIP_14675 [bacterium]